MHYYVSASLDVQWPSIFYLCPSICHRSCEHDILKMNKPIFLKIGTNGLQGKGMKWSTFGVSRSWISRRSWISITQCRNRSKKSLLGRFLQNYRTDFNQTWQAHILVNIHCDITAGMQLFRPLWVN